MLFIFAAILFISVLQWDHVTSLNLSPKQQCILNDVSWRLKVKFLKRFMTKHRRRDVSIQALVLPGKNKPNNDRSKDDIEALMRRKKNIQLVQQLRRNVAVDFLMKDNMYPSQPEILDGNFESSLSIEENYDNNDLNVDRAGVRDGLGTDNSERKHLYRRAQGNAEAAHDASTEKDMKLKLFRLMYDTVKDNDELVHKADTIKKEYEQSNYFEIGFVMGAITDKVNTMSDVALTVERLYDEWKPIEHVNAYEQIANQAIEINHLIDILQSAYKKTKATGRL